jgi:hypothetical protein
VCVVTDPHLFEGARWVIPKRWTGGNVSHGLNREYAQSPHGSGQRRFTLTALEAHHTHFIDLRGQLTRCDTVERFEIPSAPMEISVKRQQGQHLCARGWWHQNRESRSINSRSPEFILPAEWTANVPNQHATVVQARRAHVLTSGSGIVRVAARRSCA